MKFRTLTAAAILLAAAAAPLAAEPASESGAQALKQQFSEYFGPFLTDQGIVTIEPKGDDYALAIDVEKAFELLKLPGAALKMDKFVTLLTPLPDGAWRSRGADYPAVSFHMPTPKGEISGAFEIKGYKAEGLYTPNLPEIFHTTGTIETVEANMHIPDATGSGANIELLEAGVSIEAKASAAGPSEINFSISQAIKRAAEIVTMTPVDAKGAALGAPVKVAYNFGAITSDAAIDALRARALANIWTWLIAHISAEKTAAAKAELKSLVAAALPLWDKLGGSVTINDMSFEMPQGSVTIKSVTEILLLSGLTPTGGGRFALKFDGVNVQSPLLPAWSAQLQPAALDFDVMFAVDGLDKIATVALEAMDMEGKAPLGKEAEAKIAALFLSGSPKITLAPGHFTLPLIDLSFEGEAALTPPAPSGHFAISADGLDKMQAFLQKNAAAMPAMGQAIPGLIFAKGLAKTDAGGKLTWVIEITGDKSVTVNGQKFPPGK